MELYIERQNETKNYELKKKKKLVDVLKELNISVDSVILVKNDKICLEDEFVENSDKIKILSVVSGG